ncbi:MAG: hypothetical protein CEN90_479 [Parcubacteria group bacterium Licking1014_17]|nr:MAG: hypothetical protein CEN90_479 [Parcubacteria group bacterium Licking1014_17]
MEFLNYMSGIFKKLFGSLRLRFLNFNKKEIGISHSVTTINQSGGQAANVIVNKLSNIKVQSADGLTTAIKISDSTYSDLSCSKCGTMIGLLVGTGQCPKCKNILL